MKRIFKKSNPTEQVVFRTTIELNSDSREKCNSNSNSSDKLTRLKPNGTYSFSKEEVKFSYEELEKVLTKAIETELQPKVNELLDDKPIRKVKIVSVNEGSIEIIFIVTTTIISNIIYDLIKYTAKKLLTRILNNNYGYFFDVDVDIVEGEIIRNCYEEKCGRDLPMICYCIGNSKRDAFLYYLFFLIFSLALIALLAVIIR